MTTISIIVPVFNVEKYIKQCLNSLLSQTFRDIEILCVDDGSSDNSLQIIKEYAVKDSRIKVFSQKNSGVGIARNVGLKNATGQYIMFCDSDDWYEPTMCKTLYDAIISNNVDCVMCGCQISYECDDEKRRSKEGYFNAKRYGLITNNFHHYNVLLWNKIFKKSIIDAYQINFPPVFQHEDDGFYLKYSLVCKSMLSIPDKIYNYRVRANSLMVHQLRGTKESCLGRILVAKDIINFAKWNALVNSKKEILIHVVLGQLRNSARGMNLKEVQHEIQTMLAPLGCRFYITEKEPWVLEGNFFQIYCQYYRYKLLSKITFGSKRKHYKEKKYRLHESVRAIRCYFNEK